MAGTGKPRGPLPLPVVAVVVLLAVVGGALAWLATPPEEPAAPPPMGGPFTLVDHNGRTVTDADFRGQYLLIFFGYTFCPDVCPTTASTITRALDSLALELAEKVTPLFISVDPERDTPEVLKSYVANFHPNFVGLTGSKAQIDKVVESFRVYYAKAEADSGDGFYLIDHSAQTFLVGPDGDYRRHFPHGIKPETLAGELRRQMGR